MESIDWLKDDLWRRWRDRMDGPAAAETQVSNRRVVYGRGPLYDLKTYTPRRFEPGGRTSDQPFPRDDNWIYRLDDAGRPVQMDTRHSVNRIDWYGMYEYTADGAEYVEWCVQTGVCSQYARITIREGVPAAFQRLAINARGSFPVWQGVARRTLIELIASDRKNYQIAIERYDVHGGRILALLHRGRADHIDREERHFAPVGVELLLHVGEHLEQLVAAHIAARFQAAQLGFELAPGRRIFLDAHLLPPGGGLLAHLPACRLQLHAAAQRAALRPLLWRLSLWLADPAGEPRPLSRRRRDDAVLAGTPRDPRHRLAVLASG